MLKAALDARLITRVLPDYQGLSGDIWAVYPSRRHLSAKVRLFVEHLAQLFKEDKSEPRTREDTKKHRQRKERERGK
jgi:DNA-binding transcriptional LysR family regulator